MIAFVLQAPYSFGQKIGNWSLSTKNLPVYNYVGSLPFTAVDKNGKDANLPEDPYFLLGNYRMTLITHVSGIYQLLTAERAWARMNAAEQTNYGWNDANIVFGNNKSKTKVNLVGLESIAANPATVQKEFGVGFARYSYKLENEITCTRIISTKPSTKINTGNPSFVVTVIIKNNGSETQAITYNERMLANFVLNSTQYTETQKRPLLYHSNISIDERKQTAIADVNYKPNLFIQLPKKNERFIYDVDPPILTTCAANKNNA